MKNIGNKSGDSIKNDIRFNVRECAFGPFFFCPLPEVCNNFVDNGIGSNIEENIKEQITKNINITGITPEIKLLLVLKLKILKYEKY